MLELDELRDLLEGRRGNPPVEKTDIETAIQALLAHQIVYPDTSLLRRDVYDLIRRHSTFFERYFGAMGVGIVIEPPTGMIAMREDCELRCIWLRSCLFQFCLIS